MGMDKFRNLILTAREDHNPDSPNYQKGGPKIHFDLSGYDILFWEQNNLSGFKGELEKRIRRRLVTLASYTPTSVSPWDREWISEHQSLAFSGLKRYGKSGFMEIRMTLPGSELNVAQEELLRVAERAQISTFGWALGIVANIEEGHPRPRTDGIVAEIELTDRSSYDYWTIRRDGTFYLLKNLFENKREQEHIFLKSRIYRITETLLYCVRLYSSLKVGPDSPILIGIRHGGLKDRILTDLREWDLPYKRICKEDEVDTEVKTTLARIEPDLVDLVQTFTEPLFVLFDFFKLDRKPLENIVNKFVAGKVT